MATLEDVYKKVSELTHEERVKLATVSGNRVMKYLIEERGFHNDKAIKFLIYITALFIGADGILDEDEHRLFNDVLGTSLPYDEVKGLLGGGFNEEFVSVMDQTIDGLPDDVKFDVCDFGLAFLAADGRVSNKEKEVFERILR